MRGEVSVLLCWFVVVVGVGVAVLEGVVVDHWPVYVAPLAKVKWEEPVVGGGGSVSTVSPFLPALVDWASIRWHGHNASS